MKNLRLLPFFMIILFSCMKENEVKPFDPVVRVSCGSTGISGEAIRTIFEFDGSGLIVGDSLTYSWDFGDGKTGKGITTTHVYSEMGKYATTLAITNNNDEVKSSCVIRIDVKPEDI